MAAILFFLRDFNSPWGTSGSSHRHHHYGSLALSRTTRMVDNAPSCVATPGETPLPASPAALNRQSPLTALAGESLRCCSAAARSKATLRKILKHYPDLEFHVPKLGQSVLNQ